MTTMLPDRHGTFYVCAQTQLGTAGELAAALALRVSQIEWSLRADPLIDVLDTDAPYPGGVAPVIGSTGWGVSFRVDLQSVEEWRPGGTDIPLLTLLRSMVATVDEDDGDVTISPMTGYTLGYEGTAIRPCTVYYVEEGGNTYRAVDCVATYTLEAQAGQRIQLVVTLHGLWTDPVETTFSTPPVYTGYGAPLTFRGATLTATPEGGTALDPLYLSGAEWNPGTPLQDVLDGLRADAVGTSFAWHTEYARLSLEIGAAAEDALPVWALYRGRTLVDVELELPGGVTLATPYARLRPPERTARYEARAYDLQLDAVPSDSGDDLYTITWAEQGAS